MANPKVAHLAPALVCAALLLPREGTCDGGGPLLLLVNTPVFLIGQIWIVASEWWLLTRKIATPRPPLLGVVVVMNLASTFGGAILAPALWAAVTALLSWALPHGTASGLTLALGTWIIGDNSPFPRVAMIATGIGFLVTFVLTVAIEKRVLRRWLEQHLIPTDHLSSWVVTLNLVSYAGLVLLFGLGIAFT